MKMGKIQEVVDELKKKFPEVNKAGGFFSTAEYTLYRQGPGLDSLVNKQMKLSDKDFLFYYGAAGTFISFTDTYFYFSGMHSMGTRDCDISTIMPFSKAYLNTKYDAGATAPIFRIEIDSLLRIKLIDHGPYAAIGSDNIYNFYFENTDESENIATSVWSRDANNFYYSIINLFADIVCKDKLIMLAKNKEQFLDYDKAIEIWEELGENKEAGRVRKLKAEQGSVKVDQTVVHGDYVDDRDTIIKDSVLNRSNVGGGSSKMQELKELTAMKKEGMITAEEFEKMKKRIIG
jgi:hypothetical protein